MRTITVLDSATLGEDLDLSPLSMVGKTEIYANTAPEDVADRLQNSDVVVINKVKLHAQNLAAAPNLRLICVAATGYDNIDVAYCRRHGIAVCNVKGYSTFSVTQITVATVLSLVCHLPEHTETVRSGRYTASGVANSLTPVYHELMGQTWGILGYGHIGRQVGEVARALGCRVIYTRRHPDETQDTACVDIESLFRQSDVLTIHTPLTDATRGIVNRERIAQMKPGAVLVNAARGAVTDEQALAEAIEAGRLGGLGSDVYSVEPFGKEHPFYRIKDRANVCLTPHMAWGAYEARERCLCEIVKNINAFFAGEIRSRVDLPCESQGSAAAKEG